MDQWHGCYDKTWKATRALVDEAYRHPAKISAGLVERIYEHALASGWLTPGTVCLDPFGGIAGTALWPAINGYPWRGVELEQTFVSLAEANIALWRRRFGGLPKWVEPRIAQGDSRRLGEVIAVAGLVVASPPYARSIGRQHGIDWAKAKDPGTSHNGGPGRDALGGLYGTSPGQLAALPEGQPPSLIVTSPPYIDSVKGDHGERETAEDSRAKRRTAGGSLGQSERHGGYGVSDGQLGAMAEGTGPGLVVSSPPYGDENDHERPLDSTRDKKGRHTICLPYGTAPGNIGNASSDTFWSAAQTIVAEVYRILAPGGHAIWVLKDFVRAGKRVPFSGQWQALCESIGFVTVCRHQAMLVKHLSPQRTLDGGTERKAKSRKGFFRQLAEKHGAPPIDWEDVVCQVKPGGSDHA